MEDIENRIGIEPIDQLLAEKNVLIEKVADLRAVYGSFGTHDASRKSELARIKGLLRAQYTKAQVKVTETMLDDEAHCHSDYTSFITRATRERAEWVRLESQVEAIDAKLFRGNAIIRYVSNEPRV